MRIRQAKKQDIGQCLKLQRGDDESYWKKRDFELALKDKNVIFLVADEIGKIKGYAIGYTSPTKKTDVMVHETRVSMKERGKGIGTQLVRQFCKEAFKRGAKDIYALIEKDLCKFYINSCKFKKSHVWQEVKISK